MLDVQVSNQSGNAVSQAASSWDPQEVSGQVTIKEAMPELMAPGHPYNPRTGTGIEWLPMPAEAEGGGPGLVRLWSRGWNGQPIVLAEAEHRTDTAWEYWYKLVFADCFPRVTHWWFGDAWTGPVCIWSPDSAGRDPESGAPTLMGWMRFGSASSAPSSEHRLPEAYPEQGGQPGKSDADNDRGNIDGPALPWTVVLTSPVRVNTPLPPFSTSVADLPLQMLLAGSVIDLLERLGQRRTSRDSASASRATRLITPMREEIVLTSLVRREDLWRAFPSEFGPWRLDKLPDLTPREALCRVLGLQAPD